LSLTLCDNVEMSEVPKLHTITLYNHCVLAEDLQRRFC